MAETKFVGTAKKATTHVNQNEGLMFEKSSAGKKAYRMAELDVPAVDAAALLGEAARTDGLGVMPELSEIEIIRHFTRLSTWNYAIDLGMYPLGSCTMKYNPRVNEVVSRLEGIADAHPYRPEALAQGCLQIMKLLSECLIEITGMDAITLQPAAGAHGEFTGILLVRAYQEMAQQLNLTQTAAEFAHALQRELDVEGVLRKTMEWILMKLGPLNAAIYLPNGEGHFALGAYLNLDTQADALLIEALGRTVVEQARGPHPVVIEDDRTLEELFGDDARTLLGRQWLATGCQTPRECLAVLVIFRVRRPGDMEKDAPGNSSLSAVARGLLEAISPILGERIEQALGLYQRMHPFPDEEVED